MLKRVLMGLTMLTLAVAAFGQAGMRKVMPRDVLRISVYNQPQFSSDLPVDPNGDVYPLYLRPVHAGGKTVDELITEFTRLYTTQLFLKNPIVSLTYVSQRPQRATVGGGGVPAPKTVEIVPGDTVLTLLNEGGGFIRDVADLRRAYIRRGGTFESIPIDLYALTQFGDLTQNYPLIDGDELIVPESRGNDVLVLGAVGSPGRYPYREPMTVEDAIADAHFEIRLRSRFSRTVVLRQREALPGQYVRIPVDLVRFIRKGDSTQNIALQPGDIVFVPETNTPDFAVISQVSQSVFLFQTIGQFFGFRLFR